MKEGSIIEEGECEGLGSNPRWVADCLCDFRSVTQQCSYLENKVVGPDQWYLTLMMHQSHLGNTGNWIPSDLIRFNW